MRPAEPTPAASPDDASIAFEAPPPRGYWTTVWPRFKRDRVALVGGIALVFLLGGCFLGAVGSLMLRSIAGVGRRSATTCR